MTYSPNGMRARNQQVIDEFRANGGVLTGEFAGNMLLLTTTGRRSGREHTAPMMYKGRGETCFVIASNAGAKEHPDWYLNLLADPQVIVERRGERYEAIARTATGEEREAMWAALLRTHPNFEEYQAMAGDRLIPLVLLEPRAQRVTTTPPADDFALAAQSTPLARFVLDAIDEAGGRITFAQFMALALGHPEHGYYSRTDLAWGARGDYETSPEVHPIFGYLWARQIEECWQRLDHPPRFDLIEIGAGSGAFSVAMLTWLRARAPECFAAVRPVLLDGHPNRLAAQRAAIEDAGLHAEHALLDDWLAAPERVTGVVVSNEFFDALPVHLVTRRGDAPVAWSEWHVARDPHNTDALTFVEDAPSTPDLAATFARLDLLPGDGARAEVGLAAVDAMRRIASKIERGYVLTIDYGYESRELYASWRREGTLMAFRAHSPVPNPLSEPGRTDITYHVDLTSLAAAALESGDGWHAAPLTSQAEALTVLGLPDALRAAESRAHEDALRFLTDRRAAETLTDPTGLGRIRVLALARHADLDGLACLRDVSAMYGPRA